MRETQGYTKPEGYAASLRQQARWVRECNLDGTIDADELDAAAAFIDGSSGWQPIETAPRDGREILLFTVQVVDDYCDEAFSAVQIGRWDNGNTCSDPLWARAPGWDLHRIGEPTHWMPLPPPPLPLKAKGEMA